jgi:hypothetical protein
MGGVTGAQAPVEGGSGKAAGFEAWGKAFPLLFIQETYIFLEVSADYSVVLGSWVNKPLAT